MAAAAAPQTQAATRAATAAATQGGAAPNRAQLSDGGCTRCSTDEHWSTRAPAFMEHMQLASWGSRATLTWQRQAACSGYSYCKCDTRAPLGAAVAVCLHCCIRPGRPNGWWASAAVACTSLYLLAALLWPAGSSHCGVSLNAQGGFFGLVGACRGRDAG